MSTSTDGLSTHTSPWEMSAPDTRAAGDDDELKVWLALTGPSSAVMVPVAARGALTRWPKGTNDWLLNPATGATAEVVKPEPEIENDARVAEVQGDIVVVLVVVVVVGIEIVVVVEVNVLVVVDEDEDDDDVVADDDDAKVVGRVTAPFVDVVVARVVVVVAVDRQMREKLPVPTPTKPVGHVATHTPSRRKRAFLHIKHAPVLPFE